MTMTRVSDIYTRFEDFYAEFLEIKSSIFGDVSADVKDSDSVNHIDDMQVGSTQQECLTLIKNTTDYVRDDPSLKSDFAYALCCFVDDDLIRTKWPGQKNWAQQPLEALMFETSCGGEEIFQRIENLLHINDGRLVNQQRAQFYFLILALGFRGRYLFDESFSMYDYKRNLFSMLSKSELHETPFLREHTRELLEQPYQHTHILNHYNRLPTLRHWLNILGGICVAYFIVAYGAWLFMTHDINAEMQQLQQQLVKASSLWEKG